MFTTVHSFDKIQGLHTGLMSNQACIGSAKHQSESIMLLHAIACYCRLNEDVVLHK